MAVGLGERLFRDGFRYAKYGVMITELLPEAVQQPALWSALDRERTGNATRGRGTILILSAGPKDAAWQTASRVPVAAVAYSMAGTSKSESDLKIW